MSLLTIATKELELILPDTKRKVKTIWPQWFSENAATIIASRYFFYSKNDGIAEISFFDLVNRVCETIAKWALEDGYLPDYVESEKFCEKLKMIIIHQKAAFNSPVWFNVGIYEKYGKTGDCEGYICKDGNVKKINEAYKYPQTSACFIISIDDNLEAIFDTVSVYAKIFKFGSGVGTNLSTIRSKGEFLRSNDGKPSGPISFMRVLDATANVVKSGGKTRRAAIMQILNIDHPDILEFIQIKAQIERWLKENEQSEYIDIPFQNANFSVRVNDKFMNAVKNDEDWELRNILDGSVNSVCKARSLFDEIAKAAWECGDPGLQYDTLCNEMNTTPFTGRINATNPCSEVHLPDNTACNLASVNLVKFWDGKKFDVNDFVDTCKTIFLAQEVLINRSSYPTEKIALNSYRLRPIGLGFTNLGTLLMLMKVAYGSKKAQTICKTISFLLTAAALEESVNIASIKGAYEASKDGRGGETNAQATQQVLLKYLNRAIQAEEEVRENCPELYGAIHKAVEIFRQCWNKPVRNSQFTSIAPTGTISFMMDADTTGIEPIYSLVTYKRLMDGTSLTIINKSIRNVLSNLGYSTDKIEKIEKFIKDNNSVINAPELREEHYPIFASAMEGLTWQDHLGMVVAAQTAITQGISKTINLPQSATVDDIKKIYLTAWELKAKCISIYRDGSKAMQILSSTKKNKIQNKANQPIRRKLPETRNSITHKFTVGNHEGYLIVGLFEDGSPGELFINISKEGSTIRGLCDVIGIQTSLLLQYGCPLEVLVNKLEFSRFEPAGFSSNKEIGFAYSLIDYIFRWLKLKFIQKSERKTGDNGEAIYCYQCAGIMQRTGACYTCINCGATNGCA